MKKLIPFATMCILACIVLSSCNSSFEITKRRYNKGYYIDRSNSKEMGLITKEKATQVKIAAPSNPAQAIAEKKTDVSTPNLIPAKTNTIITARAEKQGHKPIVQNTSQPTNNLPAATEASSVQTVSAVSGLNSVTDDGDHHGRGDALSLFWLIILIVLILWAVGLIAGGWGLGGFINLLLLIALILLILWLLRIV